MKRLGKLETAFKALPVDAAGQASHSGPAMAMHDQIAIAIGVDIVTGLLPEGSLLPTEMEATEQHGVSRTVYREAIRTLVGKGLVSSRKKAGTRVTTRREWSLLDPEVLSWMFTGKPTEGDVRSLFELRMIVEPSAAALAAGRRNDDQLAAMGSALDEMEQRGLRDNRGQEADARFHSLILEATGNDFLMALADSIKAAIRWTTLLKFGTGRHPRDPMALHRDLFSAISDRDPELARAVSVQLLVQAREDTEQSISEPDA